MFGNIAYNYQNSTDAHIKSDRLKSILSNTSMSTKNTQDTQFDYLAKAIIVGDSAVGKSNILLRYVKQEFKVNHITTIGVDFRVKTIKVGGVKIKMQIWDTAGQQRFKAITETYFRGAHAAILTYAVNNRRSFDNVESWMRKISEAEGSISMVLVGNKSDVESFQRQVSSSEGQQLARKYQIPFIQCSAKENQNIHKIFEQIGQGILQNIKNSRSPTDNQHFSIRQRPSPIKNCQC